MSALAVARLSVEEYLALDRAAEVKSEYFDGYLVPMGGVSLSHAAIAANTAGVLTTRLKSSPCQAYASSLRVRVSPRNFYYPDLLIVCGEPALTDEAADTVTNPKVILEILSPSTEGVDYGKKFALYRRLPSLEEYVLIAQDEPRVDVFRRAADNRWVLTFYEGHQATIPIESAGVELPLSEIYDRVKMPSA